MRSACSARPIVRGPEVGGCRLRVWRDGKSLIGTTIRMKTRHSGMNFERNKIMVGLPFPKKYLTVVGGDEGPLFQ